MKKRVGDVGQVLGDAARAIRYVQCVAGIVVGVVMFLFVLAFFVTPTVRMWNSIAFTIKVTSIGFSLLVPIAVIVVSWLLWPRASKVKL